jgi:hypothetical protein
MTPLPDSSRGETDIFVPCAWFQNRTWRFICLSFRARADLKGFKEDYERGVPAGNLREIPDKKFNTLSTDSLFASVLFCGSGQEVYKGVGGSSPVCSRIVHSGILTGAVPFPVQRKESEADPCPSYEGKDGRSCLRGGSGRWHW